MQSIRPISWIVASVMLGMGCGGEDATTATGKTGKTIAATSGKTGQVDPKPADEKSDHSSPSTLEEVAASKTHSVPAICETIALVKATTVEENQQLIEQCIEKRNQQPMAVGVSNWLIFASCIETSQTGADVFDCENELSRLVAAQPSDGSGTSQAVTEVPTNPGSGAADSETTQPDAAPATNVHQKTPNNQTLK